LSCESPPNAARGRNQVTWLSRTVPVRLVSGESLSILPGSGEPGYEEAHTVRFSYE